MVDFDPDAYPVTFIRDSKGLAVLAEALSSASRVAVDTETHAARVLRDGTWAALRVIAVATRSGEDRYAAFVVDVRDIPVPDLARAMSGVGVADGWNANFDDRVLRLAGCPVAAWRDAMLTDGLLHSGAAGFEFWHSLAHAAKKFLGLELSGKGTTQVSYDGSSDLSEEQVAYPARDALITLRLAEVLDEKVARHGLGTAVELEQAARPFILAMMEHGIPFDQAAWASDELSQHVQGKAAVLSELARLTRPQETLFGGEDVPDWNPDSDAQARKALNEYATEAVLALTGGRPLSNVDKLDKTTLKRIDHPLCRALLKYRDHAKVLSTYGENLDKFVAEDGRIRPRYKQGGVVATGRLASDQPNAQNFSPRMKPYFRPRAHELPDGSVMERAFVYADLSQAELRVLAQASGEERMRELFRLGGDFHARTAADMFAVDMDELREQDPVAYGNNRKKAKGVNFGIPYGLGAAALATNLTVNSKLETSTEEAAGMLRRYGEAYPSVQAWLSARDKFIRTLASDPGAIDWDASFRLLEVWRRAEPLRRSFKRTNKRQPSLEELVDLLDPADQVSERLSARLGRPATQDEVDAERESSKQLASWALTFDAPVVVTPSGSPWFFESRSATGRRRLFTVPMDSSTKDKFEGVLTSAVLQVCTSDDEKLAEVRAEFAALHSLDLPVGVDRHPQRPGEDSREYRERQRAARSRERVGVVKVFEGDRKPLKLELMRLVSARLGARRVREGILPEAMSDQVRSMGNKYRNHPIQSLVADVGLMYYADLHSRLARFRAAWPVQAVHDSIVIECDLEQAFEVCSEVRDALQSALGHWCPDVPAVADADVRLSLDDGDVVDESKVRAMLAGMDVLVG